MVNLELNTIGVNCNRILLMNRIPVAFMLIFFCVVVTSCCKEDDSGCLGCGIDTSVHEFSFMITGNLSSDCSGIPASFKTIEFYNLCFQDTLSGLTHTDENGHFSITYNRTLPGYYSMNSNWSSLCILYIKEDSVTYYLPGLRDLDNLNLTLNDSIDLNIYVDVGNIILLETDTLVYRFESSKVPHLGYAYKIGGPVSNHQLINHIKDKWRFIDLDNYEGPALKMYWKIIKQNGFISSSGFNANATKKPCLFRQDSLIINLN